MNDVSSEPSMEEILSSIKRIIAEDSEANVSPSRGRRTVGGARPPREREEEAEVLELTDQLTADPVEVAQAPRPSDRPEAEARPLVSPTAAEASRSSLAALSALIVKPAVHGSDTLEGLVGEMLKPILAEWLDARLPDIVERLVKAEISRITTRD